MPYFTALKGYYSRRGVSIAFIKYFKNKGHKSGSALIKNHYNVTIKNGYSVENTAKFKCGGSITILINTVPSTF